MSAELIAAGGNILSGIIGGASASHEATKTRRWQENMRSTQYQTAVKDMKAAGLNPILAYKQGGAGTPSGATAPGYDLKSPGTAYLQAKQLKAQTENAILTNAHIVAQTEKTEAEKEKIEADTRIAENTSDITSGASSIASDANQLYNMLKDTGFLEEVLEATEAQGQRMIDNAVERYEELYNYSRQQADRIKELLKERMAPILRSNND